MSAMFARVFLFSTKLNYTMGSLSVHTKTMKYMKTDNEKSKV